MNCPRAGQFWSGGNQIWGRAQLFVVFYNLIHDQFNGDGPTMCHWLRSENDRLLATPFTLIIDNDDLQSVVDYLKTPEPADA